jgi:SAM-dependent methyltransferase
MSLGIPYKRIIEMIRINAKYNGTIAYLYSHRLCAARLVEYPILIDALSNSKLVLDVGSGRSLFPKILSTNNHKVVAVDLSQRAAKTQPNGIACDARFLPFKDGAFDAAVSISALEHIPDRKKAMEEMKRVVHSNGKVVITMPIDQTEPNRLWDRFKFVLSIFADRDKGYFEKAIEPEEIHSFFPHAQVLIFENIIAKAYYSLLPPIITFLEIIFSKLTRSSTMWPDSGYVIILDNA